MCPQACDDEILSSERTNEIREDGAEDADGWRSTQHIGLNQGRTRHRTWKRQFDATEASEHSRPPVSDHRRGRLVLRRPIARYRRSVGTEGAGASAAVDLSAEGSYEAPINLSSPDVGMGIGSQASGSEIINLDADTDVGRDSQDFKSSEVPYSLRDQSVSLPSIRFHENNRGSINAEPSRGRSNGLGEPLPKRICNMAEGAVDSRSDEIPTHAGARPNRNYGFFRASGRSWGRERTRPLMHSSIGDIRPINIDDVGSPQTEQRERSRQLDQDERLARQLQEAFASDASVSGNDADLARVLQEEENRRLRAPPPPPPMAVDPARMHMLYLRHIERARAALYGRNHHASSSRQGEMPRRSRIFGGPDASRRFRFPSSAAMEERLNVIGALLQGQVPLAMQLAYVDRDFNENDYEMLLALDDNVRQRGASQSRIDELPVTEFEATDSTEPCSICLEVPEAGDQVRRLPCMHGFHQECIDTWLQRRANCPVCKAAI